MLYIYNSSTNFSFKKHILSTYIHGNEKKQTTSCLAHVRYYTFVDLWSMLRFGKDKRE